jgi:hypothetical protein
MQYETREALTKSTALRNQAWSKTIGRGTLTVKSTHRGLAKPDDPVYKQGWSSYTGPLQNELIEKPTNSPPQKPSETAEKPVAEAENPEEKLLP